MCIRDRIEALCDRVLLLRDGKIVEDRQLQKSTGTQDYTIILDLNDSLDVVKLETIEGIANVSLIKDKTYRIVVRSSADVSTLIFDEVVQQGLKIKEMKREQSSLQQIFQ